MTRFFWHILALLRVIPINSRRNIFRALGRVYAALPLREVKLARAQLKVFLGRPNTEMLVTGVFTSVAETIAEALSRDSSETSVSCPDSDLLAVFRGRDQPLVALGAHIGNWERMASFFVNAGAPFTVVSREARNPALQPLLLKLRASGGFKTIWRDNRSGIRALIEKLKSNTHLAALIDQDTTVKGINIPFFGRMAHTPVTLVELGFRYGAKFVFVYNYRVATGQYVVRIETLPGETPEQILTTYNSRLEAVIREHPTQWVWFHKRWRTTAAGRKMSTSEYLSFLEQLQHA